MDLDHWLDTPMVRTRHARASPADADALWSAAASVRLRDCRLLGRLIRARIPGLSSSLTFDDMFRGDPFIVLDEGPAYLLSGLLGRIWSVRRDFTVPRDPDEFRRWQVPGTARVLFATWAEPGEGGGSALVSEVRVAAVDRRAALYIRGLSPFIAAFQGLVGVEPLTVAVQRAR